jgi:hypothetical protein
MGRAVLRTCVYSTLARVSCRQGCIAMRDCFAPPTAAVGTRRGLRNHNCSANCAPIRISKRVDRPNSSPCVRNLHAKKPCCSLVPPQSPSLGLIGRSASAPSSGPSLTSLTSRRMDAGLLPQQQLGILTFPSPRPVPTSSPTLLRPQEGFLPSLKVVLARSSVVRWISPPLGSCYSHSFYPDPRPRPLRPCPL